jgi:cobalt transporter subunit CbtB
MLSTRETPRTVSSRLTALFITFVLGIGILYVAGHAQSSTLHNAAHDARHTSGFPCH